MSMKNLSSCRLCGADTLDRICEVEKEIQVFRCLSCDLIQNGTEYTDQELARFYETGYCTSWDETPGVFEMKLDTCKKLIRKAQQHCLPGTGTMLDIGCAQGYMLEAGRDCGYQAEGVEISSAGDRARSNGFRVWPRLEEIPVGERFEIISMIDVIEHFTHPSDVVGRIEGLLAPGGVVLIVTPNYDSLSRKLMRGNWWHFVPEHMTFFSPRTMERLLGNGKLRLQEVGSCYKTVTMGYVSGHLSGHSNRSHRVLGKLLGQLPPLVRKRFVTLPAGMLVLASKNTQENV